MTTPRCQSSAPLHLTSNPVSPAPISRQPSFLTLTALYSSAPAHSSLKEIYYPAFSLPSYHLILRSSIHMQLDSHRRQVSLTMPCSWSRRCNAAANDATNALPSPSSAPDVHDWKTVRRQHLRMMRKQVRTIVLLMALMESMRVGPIQLVYAGTHGYPEKAEDDFGVCEQEPYVGLISNS